MTIAVSLLAGLGARAAHADTVVQVPLPGVLDARSVTTLTDGQLVVFTLPTDGGNLQNAFATQAVATLKGKPVANALPDDGKFPANARHPEVVLNFSNAAAATSAQTHLIPPSGKVMFPVPPAVYSKFFLFFNGAAGGTTIKVTLTYTDGMSTANATIPDYYDTPTDPAVFDLAPNLAKWDKNTVINEADHHSINGVEVLPTTGKTLTNVQVERGAEGNLVFWGATGVATTDIASGGAGGAGGVAGAAGAPGSAGAAGSGDAGGGGAGGQASSAGGGGGSAGTTSGAGGTGTAGTVASSAGTFTARSAPAEDPGCSCRIASDRRAAWSSSAWLALAALTVSAWRVRRRAAVPRSRFQYWGLAAPLLLATGASVSACSSEPSGGGGSAGAGAASGAGASVAGAPSGGASAGAGTAGTAGAPMAGSASSAGSNAGGAGGGSAGAAGSAPGGAAGAAGSASGGSGGSGPMKQFTCPAGPYPDQVMGASTDVCVGFAYNYNYNEGPTWIKSQNAFFFTNFIVGSYMGGDIIKYTPGGQCEVWLHEVGCNGLGVSATGNLLAACHGPRAVMEYDVTSKQGRMVATMANGKMLDSPNDLIARSDGNIYFSNRTAELGNRPAGLGESLVRIDPAGATSVIQVGALNGLALSPDETKLHVVGMGTWTLDAAGVPGQKGGPTPGGDGIAVDCAGNISNNGTNSAFGGADGKTLLIVGGGTKARTVAMTVPGLP